MKNDGLGKRIKSIREELGKNQTEFGELFEPTAPKSAVSRWEHGGSPNKRRLKRIAELGEVSVDYLINGPSLSDDEIDKILDRGTEHLSINEKKRLRENILEGEIETNEKIDESKKRFEINLKRFSEDSSAYAGYDTFNNFFEIFDYIKKNGYINQMADLRQVSYLMKVLITYNSNSEFSNEKLQKAISQLLQEIVTMNKEK
ncbi:helix-turn-helix domain-containing protein [Limosilactobacillus pontis]|uniref:Helix-turn-helix domain-containing protein n=1 Tax=Limosilactobacillus pontis TaxID=35787 RepID=A0ABU7SRV2_9LACO